MVRSVGGSEGMTYDDEVHPEQEVEDEEAAKRTICPII